MSTVVADTGLVISLRDLDPRVIPAFIGSLYPDEKKALLEKGHDDFDGPLASAIVSRPEGRRENFILSILKNADKAGFSPEEKDIILKNGGISFLTDDELYHLGMKTRPLSIRGLEPEETVFLISNLAMEDRMTLFRDVDPYVFDDPLCSLLDRIGPGEERIAFVVDLLDPLESDEIDLIYKELISAHLDDEEIERIRSIFFLS
jgi:hypothetical protein